MPPQPPSSPVNPELRVEIEAGDRSATIRLVGELDMATADMFSETSHGLLAEGYEQIVLDLRELTFMDSSGLRAILKLHRAAGTSAQLEIIDGPDHVKRLFTLTGLRRFLQFTKR
ncbi:MAG TPA: STAS domain-containing protein [Solirubrobacteraceae bacterium]|nr:STAS domain-containing protein [Solirubrobacteraceae bacterium]